MKTKFMSLFLYPFILVFTLFFVQDSNILFAQDATVMSEKYNQIWNADVQKSIDENIEKNRKADAVFVLENTDAETEVKVKQISSAFRFGSNIFLFGQLNTPEKNAAYADLFGTLFNSASVAFYWKTMEPEEGKPRYTMTDRDTQEFWSNVSEPWNQPHWRRPPTDPVVEFLTSRGVNIHGHAIIYGMRRWGHPEWLPDDRSAMEPFFEKRVRELAERYGDRIQEWDVVNECYDQANRGRMPDDYTYKTFHWAQEYFPQTVRLSTNECDMSWGPNRRYVEIARDLIARGVRVDLVGVQMHIFNQAECKSIADGANSHTPTQLLAVLDTLSEAGRPIHISEITISAPSDDAQGREIQAVVARNIYRLLFSHPQVAGLTWWNAADGGAAPGEPSISGILDVNMQKKPVYFALDQLIHHEWRTNLVLKTDSEGKVAFRGFRGNYHLTWCDKSGKTQTKTVTVE